MSADTCASLRPTSGICPACNCAATRSAAAPAACSAAISAASLRMRSAFMTAVDRTYCVLFDGQCASSSTRKRAHIVSPTAATSGRSIRRATRATGSSVSSHGVIEKTSGRSTTRGASSRGMTSVASPSRGTTNMVKRSNGIA